MINIKITAIIFSAVLAAASAAVAAQPQPGRADGAGGLAGLAPDDVQDLRDLRETLQQLATDPREPADNHRRAIAALARVHEALNDWGQDGQIQWCLRVSEESKHTADLLAPLAVAAAKAGAYHLGGVRAMLDQLSPDETATGEWRHYRGQIEHLFHDMPKRAPHMAGAIPAISLQAKAIDPQALRTAKPDPRTVDLSGALGLYKLAPRTIDLRTSLSPLKQ